MDAMMSELIKTVIVLFFIFHLLECDGSLLRNTMSCLFFSFTLLPVKKEDRFHVFFKNIDGN